VTDYSGILSQVRNVYSGVATDPSRVHPFACGTAFASELGYPPATLSAVPDAAAAFAGLSAVAVFADIRAGHRLLDLGCGAGLDSFVAAERGAWVTGVDFSPVMLARARQSAGPGAVFVHAAASALPFRDELFDIALVNGIFNLNPDRHAIFDELARVLRPGAAIYGAEIILREPRRDGEPGDPANWFA
jgi:SAM-dependent methyltransferase